MTFGEKLQKLRKARGWSQEQLAAENARPKRLPFSPNVAGSTLLILSLIGLFFLRLYASLHPVLLYDNSPTPRSDFFANLNVHDLEWLFGLLIFLAAAGILLLFRHKKNTGSNKKRT